MFASLSGLLFALNLLHLRQCQMANAFKTMAFYYGDTVPVQQLSQFDIVVVVPDSNLDPNVVASGRTKYFGYTSVGEAIPVQSYFKNIPQAWKLGDNSVWGSVAIDLSAPGYPEFFVSQAVAPLWNRGFRGFFLDTLDSYEDYADTPEKMAAQQAGLVRVIQAIKTHYPTASLVLNRGFEVMPQVHDLTFAIAFESLYQTWDQENKRYTAVSADDRNDLLSTIRNIKQQYPTIPIVSIDYCPPSDKACSTSAVSKICAQGLIPYVGDGLLLTIGTAGC